MEKKQRKRFFLLAIVLLGMILFFTPFWSQKTKAACSHKDGYTEVPGSRTGPTCTESGYYIAKCNSWNCGDTKKVKIASQPALGHLWDSSTGKCKRSGCNATCNHAGHMVEVPNSRKPASCFESGYYKEKCNICGYTGTVTLPAYNSHQWDQDRTCYHGHTCKRCGTQEGALSHDWDQDRTCEHGRTCKRCGASEGALAHNWNPSTGVCRTCNKKCSHSGHMQQVPNSGKAATCTEAGYYNEKCDICGYTGRVNVPATDHLWNRDRTCSQDHTCSKCGKHEDALPHEWNRDRTCTQGHTCSKCGKSESALGHDWNPSTGVCRTCNKKCSHSGHMQQVPNSGKAATCTEAGYYNEKCDLCGYVGTVNIPALDHLWNRERTCTQDHTCKRCGKQEDALPHDWDQDRTCEHGHTCNSCGTTESALKHDWNTSTGVCRTCNKKCSHGHMQQVPNSGKAATCTEAGYYNEKCEICGYTGKVNVPASGHLWDREQTCTQGHKCTRSGCTASEPALGHLPEYSSATCTLDNRCTRCHTVLEKAKGHDFSREIRRIEPTCGQAGSITVQCSRCSETRGENIPPTNAHVFEVKERIEPTEDMDGYILKYCKGCGREEKTPLPRLGSLSADVRELSFSEETGSRTIRLSNVYDPNTIQLIVEPSTAAWLTVRRDPKDSSGCVYIAEVKTKNEGEKDRQGLITFRDTKGDRILLITVSQSRIPGCRIIFHANGGMGWESEIQVRQTQKGKQLYGVFPEAPHAPAYQEFDGWYTTKKDGGTRYFDFSAAPSSPELHLYAHWKDKSYKIVYDGNGSTYGSMYDTDAVCNREVTLSENKYYKTGYVLSGWNTRSDGQGVEYSEGASVKNLIGTDAPSGSSVILYAHWVESKEVTVRFDVNGGKDPKNKVADLKMTVVYKEPYGDLPALPDGVEAPKDKVFAGWETEDHRKVTNTSDVEINSDHKLYAVWKNNTYTIFFDGNGNLYGDTEPVTCTYGQKVKMPKCGFDDGIGFEGWSVTRSGRGEAEHYKAGSSYQPIITDTAQETITLYAIWTKYEYSINYVDGFTGDTIKVEPADQVGHIYTTASQAPELEGLTFLGWSERYAGIIKPGDDRDKIIPAGTTKPIGSSKHYYSVYEGKAADCATVIYHPNGGSGSIRAESVERGASEYQVKTPEYYDEHPEECPKKSGYYFMGWGYNDYDNWTKYVSTVPIKSDRSIIHLYAIWMLNPHVVKVDYGYGGKVEELARLNAGNIYVLPYPMRDDYYFVGWLSEDGKKQYKAGDEIMDPDEDITFTAQWKRRTYHVEYIDRYTNELLFSKDYLSSDTLDGPTPQAMAGRTFDGWTYGSKNYGIHATISEFVETSKITQLTDAAFGKKVYKLYSHYEGSPRDGQMAVYYCLNAAGATGGPTRPTYATKLRGWNQITLSKEEPSCPGLKFLGWTSTPGGRGYKEAGKNYNYYNENGAVSEITLFACWESVYTLRLDANGCFETKKTSIPIEDVLPGQTIKLKEYKKSFGKPKGYTLLGWGLTPDAVSYATDDEFTVPNRDVTLYAIWNADVYSFIFRDAFGGEIARRPVTRDTVVKISELGISLTDSQLPGYKLKGWKYSNKVYLENDEITAKNDMTFYPSYEVLPGEEGTVIIHYLDNGGEGGPGTERYAPGTCELSKIKPTRTGYTFRGWSVYTGSAGVSNTNVNTYVQYPANNTSNKITGKSGQRIFLYAVWLRSGTVSTNALQETLEYEYGAGAFGPERLLDEYTSKDWERLNDTTYFVIRTHRASLLKDYESTVMVMHYENGSWELKAYGTKESIFTTFRLDILTCFTNTAAHNIDFTLNMLTSAAEIGICYYFPVAEQLIPVLRYLDRAYELAIQSTDYGELMAEYDALYDEAIAEEVLSKADVIEYGKGYALGKVTEYALKSKNLPDEKLELISDLMGALLTETEARFKAESGNADPYGQYDYAFSLFKDRVASQGFSKEIVDHTYEPVDKIYKYVHSNATGFNQ